MVSLPLNLSVPAPTSPRLPISFIPMRDTSLFLLRNSFASRMKRGISGFCNGVGSTTTLNQRRSDVASASCVAVPSEEGDVSSGNQKTLEEMLLQLDLEEAAARRAKLDDYGETNRRMSCVNNSDILRSARNALNQYPRFSLDGKDAMYRSSFRNYGILENGRKSVCSSKGRYELDVERSLRMPATVAGQCVIWCKPGVVAKLMGLDAVPVPVPGRSRHGRRRTGRNVDPMGCRNRNLRRMGRCELEKERCGMRVSGCRERWRRESMGSSSGLVGSAGVAGNGYCVTKPVAVGPTVTAREDWRFKRAR